MRLGHSRKARRKGRSPLLYAIPLIAIAGTMGIYVFASSMHAPTCGTSTLLKATDHVLMDFTVQLSIQVENRNGTQERFIVPPGIGIPGCHWQVHTYDSYGVEGDYPLYTDPPQTSGSYGGYTYIYVRSSVVHNFTLGDFFAVWGEPLGPANTLNFVSQANGFFWAMCVGPQQTSLRPGHWGNESLVAGMPIILLYTSPSGSGGCA